MTDSQLSLSEEPFPIKGRYVLLAWLVPLFYLPGLNTIYSLIGDDEAYYWYELVFYYYYTFVFALLLFALVNYYRVQWRNMLAVPSSDDFKGGIKLTAYVFFVSMCSTYALFLPLSYFYPEFVTFWLIELPPLIYWSDDHYPFLPNVLSFCTVVVLAPIIEEFSFRGLLLHRWTRKWNANRAIIFSSVLFGLAHTDPVGAAIFGVAMCILYLRTQTLLVPIICHGANNLVVWLIEAGYLFHLGPEYEYTLEAFQAEWWVGVASGSIVIAWTFYYLKHHGKFRQWSLPNVQ